MFHTAQIATNTLVADIALAGSALRGPKLGGRMFMPTASPEFSSDSARCFAQARARRVLRAPRGSLLHRSSERCGGALRPACTLPPQLQAHCYRIVTGRDVVSTFASPSDFPAFQLLEFSCTDPRVKGSSRREMTMSGGLPSRPLSGSLVGRSVFIDIHFQRRSNGLRMLVGQRVVGPLDSLDGHGRHPRGRSELRLGHALHHAAVARVALVGRDEDYRLDRGVQDGHGLGQDVDLGRARTSFPVVDGADRDLCESGQVADAEASSAPGVCKFAGAEAPQHAATHAPMRGMGSIAGQIHCTLPKVINKRILSSDHIVEYVRWTGATSRRDRHVNSHRTPALSIRAPELTNPARGWCRY